MFRKFGRALLRICRLHRSDDDTTGGTVLEFLVPKLTLGFFIRLGCVVATSVVVFGYVLIPCVISGSSMEPTIKSHGFTFCWRGRYLFGRAPERGDIVIIKNTDNVFFLKRVVGLPGETVAFREGKLYIDGEPLAEPYVKFICDWNLPPREVEANHYYVVGDNRSMPIEEHFFGRVSRHRIIGSPLW